MKKKNPEGKKVTESIEFKLSDIQKSRKGMDAAKLSKEVAELRIEKKTTVDTYTAKIRTAEAKMNTLLEQIDSGVEWKETEVIAHKNYDAGKMEFWLNGEKVKERELQYHERQMDIDEKPKKLNTKRKGNLTVVETKDDIKGVIKEETSAKSKWTNTDGPRA